MGKVGERPVPEAWRLLLKQIADAFTQGEIPGGDGIGSVSADTARTNFENLRSYPDVVGPLRDSSWQTSTCSWMEGYWQVLVDLNDVDGALIDLVMHAKVFDASGRVEIEPGLIYVP